MPAGSFFDEVWGVGISWANGCREIVVNSHYFMTLPYLKTRHQPNKKAATHCLRGLRLIMRWRAWLESNQRPLASEANTLSTELQARCKHALTVVKKCPARILRIFCALRVDFT